MTPVRVFIIDDSALCRQVLREVLEADGDIVVVGEAADGAEGIRRVQALRPDLVTLDVRMPKMSGLEVVAQLMSQRPLPVLVVTELPVSPTDATAFEAIRRGALDVMRKPPGAASAGARDLRERVRLLSKIPTVQHPRARVHEALQRPLARPTRSPVRVIAIGASAGGPAALAAVLGNLPVELSVAVAVVQHLPAGFGESFARFLRSRTPLRVAVAYEPIPLVAGQVVVAPDDHHLVSVGADRLGPRSASLTLGHRPSVDVLFHALAETHGPHALAVLLTGIGRDGAEGMLAMRRAGATTIAQNEASSVVFGMPKAAIELGAATHVVALDEIAALLTARAGTLRPVHRSPR